MFGDKCRMGREHVFINIQNIQKNAFTLVCIYKYQPPEIIYFSTMSNFDHQNEFCEHYITRHVKIPLKCLEKT